MTKTIEDVRTFADQITENVETVILGKREQIELLLVALLCQGHVLIEDVPGTGKTMLARAIAASMGLEFKRLQCTPDLLPNDITGVEIFNQKTQTFEFQPGPVFVNVLLADEINRATPRTQAALLEAMQEQQVTIGGVTRKLPRPFLVLATQNPIEYEGTFPLPEAQLDRFLMRLSLGYPAEEDEIGMLRSQRKAHPIESIGQVVESTTLAALHDAVTDVHVDETLERYILALVQATRAHADLALGASPRGSLALYKTGQAFAALQGRDYVIPDDIKQLVPYALPHRLILKPESQLRGRTVTGILREILEQVALKFEGDESDASGA
ncbi:MAG: AAA domain-containing protein [Chloroflexi bacterium]|jgi:MoxR-like ATPase|nr:AAA domain-containing protein [Chloroflexota bacterium]